MDTATREQCEAGKKQIEAVARRYASGHGLKAEEVRWEARGFDLLLVFRDENHQVEIPFSTDEVAYFPEGADNEATKRKIRDKFAGLTI